MRNQSEGKRSTESGVRQQNECTTSTLWEWKRVMVGTSPAAGQHSAPQALRWYHLRRWSRREWLTLRVRYRGGQECWVEIDARGSKGRFAGSTALVDALNEIWHHQDGPLEEL